MRVVLTGANGMLGRSISAAWAAENPEYELMAVTRADADLTNATQTTELINRLRPDLVIHTAAQVGGIAANIARPAEFLMDNLLIDSSVLNASRAAGVENFLYLGSSCMYPKDYRQPLVEEDILAAPLEPTNEGYAISKIAAAKYCAYVSAEYGYNYRVIIPSNLYGPDDDFSQERGHLVGAAIAKLHNAKINGQQHVDVWGDGTARREFTYVGDLASWMVAIVPRIAELPVFLNVGCGEDHSVLEYYEAAARVVGYHPEFRLDPSKPAGMKQKLMDSSRAAEFGWAASTPLDEGMAKAYQKYLTVQATNDNAKVNQ